MPLRLSWFYLFLPAALMLLLRHAAIFIFSCFRHAAVVAAAMLPLLYAAADMRFTLRRYAMLMLSPLLPALSMRSFLSMIYASPYFADAHCH